jgi:hypothetical protein
MLYKIETISNRDKTKCNKKTKHIRGEKVIKKIETQKSVNKNKEKKLT